MKSALRIVLYGSVAAALSLAIPGESNGKRPPEPAGQGVAAAFADAAAAQPKLLHISGIVDGSGRVVFTNKTVKYEHRHWSRPHHVLFDGEPWTKLDQTPVEWRTLGRRLNLSKAWIARRSGRDVIALEHTPDGFDLYLSDSPNGGAEYSVTIAIPRRN